jgi:hypothetical protein
MPNRSSVPSRRSLHSFLKKLYNSLTGQKNGKFLNHN